MNWNHFNNRVSALLLENGRLEDLLYELGCDFSEQYGANRYRGPCPVHGGDGKNFQLRTDGDDVPINWKCFSHHCEEEFKPSLLGLVRGVLSNHHDRRATLWEAVDFLKKFTRELPADNSRPVPTKAVMVRKRKHPAWKRAQVRARLQIPSPYFVGRGLSPTILDQMDVGHSAITRRSIVPLYDDQGEACIGYLERTEEPECRCCKRYHRRDDCCAYGREKWYCSRGFPKSSYLYNYHNALRSDAPYVLLVEGPGDVFRALEAGLAAVASLGNDLTKGQAKKLAALGKVVVVAFDNDPPGMQGTRKAEFSLVSHGVRPCVWQPPTKYKDVGDMPAEEVVKWMERFRQQAREGLGAKASSTGVPHNPLC